MSVHRLPAATIGSLLLVLFGPVAIALSGAGLERSVPTVSPLLVIVPPWRDAIAVLEAAGGWPIGPQTAPLATLGTLPPSVPPGLLYEAGAWAVLDGAIIAAMCGVSP